jgi:hypothetical protein
MKKETLKGGAMYYGVSAKPEIILAQRPLRSDLTGVLRQRRGVARAGDSLRVGALHLLGELHLECLLIGCPCRPLLL